MKILFHVMSVNDIFRSNIKPVKVQPICILQTCGQNVVYLDHNKEILFDEGHMPHTQ